MQRQNGRGAGERKENTGPIQDILPFGWTCLHQRCAAPHGWWTAGPGPWESRVWGGIEVGGGVGGEQN